MRRKPPVFNTSQTTFDGLEFVEDPIVKAETARDEGIRRAVEHADAVIRKWSDDAYSFLWEFISGKNPGYVFMLEDVRFLAEQKGFTTPPSKRAWGAVILRAARAELIQKGDAAGKVKDPNGHRGYASTWVIL